MAPELVKMEAAGVPMRPAMGKPTQEYGECTNLQNLSASFFFTLKFERPDKFAFRISISIFIIKRIKMESLNNVNKIMYSP
jgi:hypothetical protein